MIKSIASPNVGAACLAIGTLAAVLGCKTCVAASPDVIAGAFAGTVLIGSTTPSNRLEQIYYLGTFDPDNRVPPTFFRIRVRGQAGILSSMKFGSGWVPAGIADALNTSINTSSEFATSDSKRGSKSFLHRPFGPRLQQYGPEGFRNVPDDFRLAIVMGSSPEAFFAMADAFTATLDKSVTPSPATNADQAFLKAKLASNSDELKEWKETYDRFLPTYE